MYATYNAHTDMYMLVHVGPEKIDTMRRRLMTRCAAHVVVHYYRRLNWVQLRQVENTLETGSSINGLVVLLSIGGELFVKI